jgi:hypothetical protein
LARAVRIAICFLCLLFITPEARAQTVPLPVEQARYAVLLFQKACFMNYARPDRVENLLDRSFQRHEGGKKDLFLKFAGAREGNVWAVIVPKGVYAVVSEPAGCHVVIQRADDKEIHASLKRFAQQVRQSIPDNGINYKAPIKKGVLETSGFEVLSKSERTQIIVAASTISDPPEDKPVGIITMKIN